MIRKLSYLLSCLLSLGLLSAQTGPKLTLDGTFYRFITYYLSSVDISTGSSDVQLFDYTLRCDDNCPDDSDRDGRYDWPIEVDVSFEMSIKSQALGIPDEETLARLYTTEPFKMYAPIHLDNRDFTIETLEIYDVNGDAVAISVDIDEDASLDISEFQDMFSVIVQSGRLPDGVYRLRLDIDVVGGTGDSKEEVINVTTPTTLQLTSPGGSFEELEQNQVYTTYPVFQWESEMFSAAWIENCPECGFFIRMAEFRCEDHATVEDAMEDITVLPLDQTIGWQLVGDENGDGIWESSEVAGNQLTFMYPTTGVVDLRPGGIYVWQIQKRLSTTAGLEEIDSPIYAFQIRDLATDPVMQALEEILPEEMFDSYFKPCGPLTGYASNGVFKLDGEEGDIGTLNGLVEEFKQGARSLITTEVR